jgi:hypothetical protein
MIEIDRSRDSAFDQTFILDARAATKAMNLVVMDFPHIFNRQPGGLTFQDMSGCSYSVP